MQPSRNTSDKAAQQPSRAVSWLLEQATCEGEVRDIETVEGNLRLITFSGDDIRDMVWSPGDMVQLILSGSTLLGKWELRSYTPFAVDPKKGTMQILAAIHGQALGSDWFASAQIGTRCRFVSPKHPLSLSKPQRPMVFFGDETSFGTAIAMRQTTQGYNGAEFIFEVGSEGDARAALSRFGLTHATFLSRSADDGHLDALERSVLEASHKAAHVILTGKATSIQRLNKALRSAGLSGRQLTNVPYWSPGKKGLKGV